MRYDDRWWWLGDYFPAGGAQHEFDGDRYTVNAAWLRSTDHQVLIAHRFEEQEVRGSYATFGMPQDWLINHLIASNKAR